MKTKNLEKEFKIEIIASVIENRLLTLETHPKQIEKFTNEIFDFCKFVTDEEVNFGNLYRFAPIISNIIKEQYPTIERITPISACDLTNDSVKYLVKVYKSKYGDKLLIKSLRKVMIKSLEIQDK